MSKETDTLKEEAAETAAENLGVTPPPVIEIKVKLKGFKTYTFSGSELLRYTLLPNVYEILAVIKGETRLFVFPLESVKEIKYRFATVMS